MRIALLLSLALLGCGKHDAATGAPAAATCTDAVKHMEQLSGETPTPAKTAEVIARCEKEASPEFLQCIVDAKTKADVKPCVALMPATAGSKYANKAKATEALINVKRLYMSAQMAYEAEAATADDKIAHRFPASVGPTPPVGSCCKDGKPERCQPNPALWTDPSWQALRFDVKQPSFYSYQLKSAGTGADATFTIDAYGDLDCNGVYSTFELTGKVGADGTIAPAGEVKKVNELE